MAERTYDLSRLEMEKSYITLLFDLREVGEERCLPAIVTEYNRASHTATVLPLVSRVVSEGGEYTELKRAKVTVPVVFQNHGGYEIDAPLFAGDTGWLIAADRDTLKAREDNQTELYEDQDTESEDAENKGAAMPQQFERCKFSFGFFIPASFATSDLTATDGLVIRHKIKDSDGTVRTHKIQMSDEGVVAETQFQDDYTLKVQMTKDGVKFEGDPIKMVGDQDTVTISAAGGITHEGTIDETFEVVTNLRYDTGSHQFQKKTRSFAKRGDFVVAIGDESNWTMIEGGQAVAAPVCHCSS